jgi:hypothetical protein
MRVAALIGSRGSFQQSGGKVNRKNRHTYMRGLNGHEGSSPSARTTLLHQAPPNHTSSAKPRLPRHELAGLE